MSDLPTPVKMRQRRFGGTEAPPQEMGDCWATAVCSYAGLDERARNELHRRIVLSDLAHTRLGHELTMTAWWNITNRFLKQRGLPWLTAVAKKRTVADALYVASGPGPRGHSHVTVSCGNGELWSDPHPSDDGLNEILEWVCWWNGERIGDNDG